jgi:polysaccharide biosynthesis protein PslL
MMRNITIDIAKGIGILTVVLCHNWILYHDRGELSRVVFSFHMPLFFFISGLFFKKTNLTYKTILNKADTILKPYFVISLLVLLFTSIAQYKFNIAAFISVFYASGATAIWTPLWFLPHLFIIVITATIVTQWVDLSLFSWPKLIGLLLIMAIGASQLSLFKQANFGLPLVNYLLIRI